MSDTNSFFAFLNRMKYITRWSLMRNTERENLMEHSYFVSVVAHCLAEISNVYFGNSLNADAIAVKALYHDASEILTGDMPTPIKYLNEELKTNYKRVEALAGEKLVGLLPEKMQSDYRKIFDEDDADYIWVKYADKLCAYLKCLEEVKYGNKEFVSARDGVLNQLKAYKSNEINFFIEHFVPAFKLTLDQLQL